MNTDNINPIDDAYPFTPGPWVINDHSGETTIKNTDGVTICNYGLWHVLAQARLELYSGEKQSEQDKSNYLKEADNIKCIQDANARLIAAALDLLKAAQLALDAISIADSDARPAIIALTRAIKKVYGK